MSSEILRKQQCVHQVRGHQDREDEAERVVVAHTGIRSFCASTSEPTALTSSAPIIRSHNRTSKTKKAKKASMVARNTMSRTMNLPCFLTGSQSSIATTPLRG